MRDYLRSRLIRIYLPYLPIGIGMLMLYQVLPGLSEGGRDPSILTSVALIPDNRPPALSVAWTLVHELLFYAIYAFWFIHRQVFRVLVAVWAFLIIWIAYADLELSRIAAYFLSPLNLCFLAGVGVFHLSRQASLGSALAICASVVGVMLLAMEVSAVAPSRIVIGVAFAMLVLAATSPIAARHRVWRPLVVLGAASYSVYLVHNPVLSIAVRLVRAVLPDVGVWPAFGVIALVAAIAGVVYWRCYERPVLTWARARLARPRTRLDLAAAHPKDP